MRLDIFRVFIFKGILFFISRMDSLINYKFKNINGYKLVVCFKKFFVCFLFL